MSFVKKTLDFEKINNSDDEIFHELNKLNEKKLTENDTISASYIFKDFFNQLTWSNKPKISYRYDNNSVIFLENNNALYIKNYPYNHQKNEEWIESQKNIFNNLDKQLNIENLSENIWKSKDSIRKYLNNKYSSGRIIGDDDVIYVGLLANGESDSEDEAYKLIYFHIDELKYMNNIYEYSIYNYMNNGLIPKLVLKKDLISMKEIKELTNTDADKNEKN